MHYGTFQLAFDDQGEAELLLASEASRRGITGFVVLEPGGSRLVP